MLAPLGGRPLTLTLTLQGDAGGDMFFSSRDRWLPLACRNDTGFREPGECHMTEVADPTILAVSQVGVLG